MTLTTEEEICTRMVQGMLSNPCTNLSQSDMIEYAMCLAKGIIETCDENDAPQKPLYRDLL